MFSGVEKMLRARNLSVKNVLEAASGGGLLCGLLCGLLAARVADDFEYPFILFLQQKGQMASFD